MASAGLFLQAQEATPPETATPVPSEVPSTLTPERLAKAREILWKTMARLNNLETPPPLNVTSVEFPGVDDPGEQLRQLDTLYVNGLISPDLYHSKRAELVSKQ